MSFTYMDCASVPRPSERLPRIAVELGPVRSRVYENRISFSVLWLTNRAVAEAYGLGPEGFEYILSTFPVFARKGPGFCAYLQERVRQWMRKVEGPEVYTISPVELHPAAEASAGAYAAQPRRPPMPTRAFQQAAVLAWVVSKLSAPGCPVSRFRVQKILYLVEGAAGSGLFTKFRKQAAGHYDPGLRHHGPEDIAMRQKGWLEMPDDAHFLPGPNTAKALEYGPRYVDEILAELAIEEFRTFRDETLECWTTVHLAAVELARQGQPISPAPSWLSSGLCPNGSSNSRGRRFK